MIQLKIGVQLASLRLPFKKALLTAARLGAQAVEIDARKEISLADMSRTAVRHLRKMMEDLNLRVCAITFRTRRGYNVTDDLDRRIEATKQAMQMAYQLGASVVVNQVGQIPQQPEGASWELLQATLTDLGRHGQRVGAMLAAETGSESGEDLLRLIDHLPPGTIGVNFDPGNLIVNGFSATDAIEKLAPHVLHVHAKDAVRDLAQGRGLEVPLGRGSVDFPALLAALEEKDYRGFFTVEREKCDDPVAEVNQAIVYLKNL